MASDKKMVVKSPCKGKVRNSDYALLESESPLHQVTRLQFIAKKKYNPREKGVEQNVLDPDT